MTFVRLRRRTAAAALGAMLIAVVASAAGAATISAPLATIAVDVSAYPSVTLKVAAPVPPAERGQAVPAEAFEVLENGEPRSVTAVGPEDAPLEIVLLVDSSADAGGELVSAAAQAVEEFLQELPEYARVAVVSFGGQATVVTSMTADPTEAVGDLGSVQAGGERALFDAVVTGVNEYSAAPSTRRSMVVVTAGGDTAGSGSPDGAARTLAGSRASLYVIDATVDSERPQEVDDLVAAAGGGVLSADDPSVLAALYDRVALRLGNEYRLTFQAEGSGPTDVTVRFSHDGVTDELTRTVTFPASSQAPGQTPAATVPPTSGEAPPPDQAAPGAAGDEGAEGLLGDVTIAVALLITAVALFAAGLVAFFWKRAGPETAPGVAVPGGRMARGVGVPTGRAAGVPTGRGAGVPTGRGAGVPTGQGVDAPAPPAPGAESAPVAGAAPAAPDPFAPVVPVPVDGSPPESGDDAAPEDPLFVLDPTDAGAILAEHGQVAARPGDVGYLAVAADEPRGKALRSCRRLVVAVTLLGESDRQVLAVEGERALLRVRLERMVGQLQIAGAVATVGDLASLVAADVEQVRAVLDEADLDVRDDDDGAHWDEALDTGDTRHYRWGVVFTGDEVRRLDAHFTRHGSLPVQPGELCHLAVAADEAPDKPVRACRRVPVRLPAATARDLVVHGHDGLEAMRRQRIGRLAREAQVQNGLLTVGDLAVLLGAPAETVTSDVLALRTDGEAVPLFGSVKVGDLRPSSAAMLVARCLSGDALQLQAGEAGTLSDFARTVQLYRQGVDVGEMQLGGMVGTALLGQYVALFERARRERGGALRLGELFQSDLVATGPRAPQGAFGRMDR